MRSLLLFFLWLLPLSLVAGDAAAILKSLPTSITGCEAKPEELKVYDKPGLGASLTYHKPGLIVTVYAYDLDQTGIAGGLEDPTVKKAFTMAVSDIKEATKQGYYSKLEELDNGTATFGTDRTLRSRFRLTREKGPDAGVRFVSEIHVWGAAGNIIKLRVSGDTEREAEHTKSLEKFIPALMEALRKFENKK
jgi:hypothetical protein